MRFKLFALVNTENWEAKYRELWITKTRRIKYEWVRARFWRYKGLRNKILRNIIFFQARLGGVEKYTDGSVRDRDGFHKKEVRGE